MSTSVPGRSAQEQAAGYVPSEYWERLLEGEFDERGIGYPELARSINRAMCRSCEYSVAAALDRAGVSGPPGRVLDVGSGTGIWIDFWRRRGATEIAGADLTAASVQCLRRRWPEYDFLQADLGESEVGLPKGHDVVSAMNVLLHIVDDRRFGQAFINLAAALRPAGTLVLIDPVVRHHWWGLPFDEEAIAKPRPLVDYRDALAAAGFEILLLRPATVLLGTVGDTRSALTFHLLQRYWHLLIRGVGRRERLGAAIASVLRPADRLAVSTLRSGPSAKVLIARRVR
jgi:SAM-dependent methyltransferase